MEVDSRYRLKLAKIHESLVGLFDLDAFVRWYWE